MTVRTVNFAGFVGGSVKLRKQIGAEVAAGFEKHGFIKITNHGIPCGMVEGIFHWSRLFFNSEAKHLAPHPPTFTPHRGYSAIGVENVSMMENKKRLIDVKESFDQGASDDDLYKNIWPPESSLPGFRPFMETYFDACYGVQLVILEALAIGLGLDETQFESLHKNRMNELRMTHYPAVAMAELNEGNKTRIAEHTDFGTITLLFQDSVGGLEVEYPYGSGRYAHVETTGSEMIVNIGDCLQRWTNDRLCSNRHRVHLSPKHVEERAIILPERFSVAYFGKPDRSVSVQSWPAFINPNGEQKYEDMTAGEFLLKRSSSSY